MDFLRKLDAASRARESVLCVCLDPDPSQIPEALGRGPQAVLRFNRRIVRATSEFAAAYKLNLAFYEQLGAAAMDVLTLTLQAIPKDIPVIADAKRGDVPNTAEAYGRAFFDVLHFDAMTMNPYLGLDTVSPFVSGERFAFAVVRTSNPGARDFQDLRLEDGAPLFEEIAKRLDSAVPPERLGFVVGATYPKDARRLRALAPDRLFLLPGVGAQGGSIVTAVEASVDAGGNGVLPAVAREILYASNGLDFADAAARRASALRDLANEARRRVPASG
ncbi:MAG: orotidine-5'-phosphate decarboxylase [Chloroflexi bacterium]|nr:MAG: orotidine-5'-phosphate decarboxylase [Chloroflexota bacterium]